MRRKFLTFVIAVLVATFALLAVSCSAENTPNPNFTADDVELKNFDEFLSRATGAVPSIPRKNQDVALSFIKGMFETTHRLITELPDEQYDTQINSAERGFIPNFADPNTIFAELTFCAHGTPIPEATLATPTKPQALAILNAIIRDLNG